MVCDEQFSACSTGVLDPDSPGYRRHHELWLGQGSQRNEECAVGKAGTGQACHLHREPGLAYSAGPGEGEQPELPTLELLEEPCELLLSPHERRGGDRHASDCRCRRCGLIMTVSKTPSRA